MDTKIQELTDKIYREGVEKGNEEAGRIIADANSQKQTIVSEAKAEAERILADARKEAAELKKNTEAELKLFASQALGALKSEVANLITGQVVSENVKAATLDKAFMQQVILEMVKAWAKNEALVIQSSDAKTLTNYFAGNAKALLDKGITIEQVNGKTTAFTIAPADGSYKVTFGEEEFESFFKDFLRPQLVEMLF